MGPVPRFRQATAPQGSAFPYVKPESVGLSTDKLLEIGNRMVKWTDAGELAGAEWMLVKEGKVVMHEAVGWKDIEDETPWEIGTICRLRSMTKPFVGTAVLMLAEAGKLKLEDPVSKYLPSFDNKRSGTVTIEQLLTHSAGFVQGKYKRSHATFNTLREFVDEVGKNGPRYQPGERYSYSDRDSATLGALVAEVTGIPAETFIQERILTPLGMDQTLCNLEHGDPRQEKVSSTYMVQGFGGMTRYWDSSDPQVLSYFRASGGMYSNPMDYAKFLHMWMNNGSFNGSKFLEPDSVKMALTPNPLIEPPKKGDFGMSYGMHWQFVLNFKTGEPLAIGHTGSDGTMAYAMPDQDVMVFYFTQTRGGNTMRRFLKLIRTVVPSSPLGKL